MTASKYVRTSRGKITRTTPKTVMNAPIKEILKKLVVRGFGRVKKSGVDNSHSGYLVKKLIT